MQNDQLAAPIMLRFPSLMENERTFGRRYPRAKEQRLPYSEGKEHEKLDARIQNEWKQRNPKKMKLKQEKDRAPFMKQWMLKKRNLKQKQSKKKSGGHSFGPLRTPAHIEERERKKGGWQKEDSRN
ncbi:uncharacterized protein ZBAI_07347 [Zygosaccharomyces bailii ISA1307]|nr:uncharacterized protein ZBAI_07347 [Zygosaccharomyces bailii ISA1307]